MLKAKLVLIITLAATFIFSSCVSKDQVQKIVEENPDIIIKAIEKNPADFVEAFQKAIQSARTEMAKRQEEAEKKQLEDSFSNPLAPEIRNDEAIRGTKGAPIMLVEYSDFECPFCTRGYSTVMDIMKKYPGKVSFVYKHLPLSFHQNAMIASQYYEAIRLQDHDKAFKFHDEIFKNQGKLKSGEGFLKAIAKQLKVDMGKLAKDVKSEMVQERIKADMEEAAKYGFQGTPGFLINGIPVKGAYPASHFDGIIDELKKRGKITL